MGKWRRCKKKTNNYIEQIKMPRLDDSIIHFLENPKDLKEWEEALSGLQLGKAPGPDRLTSVYYKQFKAKLGIPFIKAFNQLQEKNLEYPSIFHGNHKGRQRYHPMQ